MAKLSAITNVTQTTLGSRVSCHPNYGSL